jgi:fucose 4-O-acetylase-like acetyltransferase
MNPVAATNLANRDTHADSIRGALAALIVFGHFLSVLKGSMPALSHVDTGFILFRMPLFVFVSGMFARKSLTEKNCEKLIERIVLPLLVVQGVYILIASVAKAGFGPADAVRPFFSLWFLVSLTVWRGLAPLMYKVPFVIPLSLLATLAAGYSPAIGNEFALSRTLYFAPFFLAGMFYGRRLLDIVRRHRPIAALILLAAITATLMWFDMGINSEVLFGNLPYAELAASPQHPALGRLGALLLSFAAALGFAGIVPSRQRTLVWLGQRSLSIYLLHSIFIYGAKFVAPRIHFDAINPWTQLTILLALSVAITILLATFYPCLDMFFRKLYLRLREIGSDRPTGVGA